MLFLEATTYHVALATKPKSICIPWLYPTAFIYDDDAICTQVEVRALLSIWMIVLGSGCPLWSWPKENYLVYKEVKHNFGL